jgi:hypothetical protein
MIRLFCFRRKKGIWTQGSSLLEKSYPSDKSNAKADRNDKAILFSAKEGIRTPGSFLLEKSYPSDKSNAKADRNDKVILFSAKEGIRTPGSFLWRAKLSLLKIISKYKQKSFFVFDPGKWLEPKGSSYSLLKKVQS